MKKSFKVVCILIIAGVLISCKAGIFTKNAVEKVFKADSSGGATTRVSVASDGSQSKSGSSEPSISEDGRYVAFEYFGDNLGGEVTSFIDNIFLHDTHTGETTLVSVASDGSQGNSSSEDPSISGDGRFVAFQSGATNLVSGDNNEERDIFLHDSHTGETTLVSVASDGSQGNSYNGWSDSPSISGDGRFVAFESKSPYLVVGDTNESVDVFLHDTHTGETTLVSVASDGSQGNDDSECYNSGPAISADGRYVAFCSFATNLVSEDNNEESDVFLHDTHTGETILVSVASDGSHWNRYTTAPSISRDGRYVAFTAELSDTSYIGAIFLHDTQTGETALVSVASDGSQGNSHSNNPSISGDGRFVVFESKSTNLVIGDTNESVDVFLHDTKTGETIRVSVDSDGIHWVGDSMSPSISGDGRYVAFESEAANLVSEDTNQRTDVFLHNLSGSK